MHLSASDVQNLTTTSLIAASPLDYGSQHDWAVATMRAVKQLTRCDIASFIRVSESGNEGATEDFDAALFEVFARFDEDDLDHLRALRGTLADGVPVFVARDALRRYARRSYEDTRIYNEFMLPAGVQDGPAMTVMLPEGSATLGIARSGRRHGVQKFERERALMALVLPAFEAGLHVWETIVQMRMEIATVLEQSATGYIAFAAGKEVYRTTRLTQLLDADQGGAQLMASIIAIVVAESDAVVSSALTPRILTTSVARYALSVVRSRAGVFGVHPAIVVAIRRLTPELPTLEQLRVTYSLTAREAEIALQLAQGRSNKVIAQALGIRPATVRTHAERVFEKLHVQSRKALGLLLIGGG